MAGKGAVDFHSDPGNQETEIIAGFQHALDRQALQHNNPLPPDLGNGHFHNAANDALEVKAILEFIWNPADNFSLGFWTAFEHNDQGTSQFGKDAKGRIREINGERNIVAVGTRPVWWLSDTFAIQGQIVGYYGDNNRGNSGTNGFGRSGEMGIITIAPTFKPKGHFFTRPEIRLFATFAGWSDSWRGTTVQGNAPYNGPNTNYGWMFGSQSEIWW
jgi:maltoporin